MFNITLHTYITLHYYSGVGDLSKPPGGLSQNKTSLMLLTDALTGSYWGCPGVRLLQQFHVQLLQGTPADNDIRTLIYIFF
jgi:hypothetical protein